MANKEQNLATNPKPALAYLAWPIAVVLIALPIGLFEAHKGAVIHAKGDAKGTFDVTLDPTEALKLAQAATNALSVSPSSSKGLPSPESFNETNILEELRKGSNVLPKAKVLWVDDNPQNNQSERLALAALGIYCDSYPSDAQASRALSWNASIGQRPYDAIISDYNRDHEFDAGRTVTGRDTYNMVRQLPAYQYTPFVFYTADGLDKVQDIVSSDPHAGSTNVPNVLLQRVLLAIPKADGPHLTNH